MSRCKAPKIPRNEAQVKGAGLKAQGSRFKTKTKDFIQFFPFSPFGPELTAEGLLPFTFYLLRTPQ